MIKRLFIDPITGALSETRKEFDQLGGLKLYPTIHYFDDKKICCLDSQMVVVEHILDPDIKSLSINITFGITPRHKKYPAKISRLLRTVATDLNLMVTKIAPDDLKFQIEILSDLASICVSIPDFSSCPLFQTEKLAEMVLERILKMVTVCGKCRFIVNSTNGLCPECGAELLKYDEIVAEESDKSDTDKKDS